MDRNILAFMRRAQRSAGFTLIEILVVVSIMAVLLSMAVSQAGSSLNTLRMKQAIASTIDTVARARQTAMTTNREVLVRIYKMPDERGVLGWRAIEFGTANVVTNPSDPNYKDPSIQNFAPTFQRLGPIERLPQGFVFHPSTTYSTLLDSNNMALLSGQEPAPEGGTHQYMAFLCLPEGRTPLATTSRWTLTIVNEQDLAKTTGLPVNFATLQVEPRTARVWLYRP